MAGGQKVSGKDIGTIIRHLFFVIQPCSNSSMGENPGSLDISNIDPPPRLLGPLDTYLDSP